MLASVLSKMVINNFKLRYQSATEVLEALQQNFHLQAETQITVAPSTLTQQPPLTLSQQQRLGLHSSNSSILSLEQYNYLENVLTTFVGPIAATLLRRTASASSYQELIDSLALHLTANQQTEFKKKVEPLLEQPTIKYENISNSLPEKIQPTTNSGISDALVRECERELLDLIGPIAVFLIQKAKKSTSATTSRTEFIKIVSDEIPDAQKAWQFQQRLLS